MSPKGITTGEGEAEAEEAAISRFQVPLLAAAIAVTAYKLVLHPSMLASMITV